jgi:hypothetical protein
MIASRKTKILVLAMGLILLESCSNDSKEGESHAGDKDTTVTPQVQKFDSLPIENEVSFEEDQSIPDEVADKNWPIISINSNLDLRSPLDGPLHLSGSFAELRGNHFHAGLDIRTGGQEGKNVYAIADGVISRIKVSSKGYGKVLYIRHKNGLTSVYGHLQKFAPSIQKYVEKAQYEKRSYQIELFPGSVLRVQKGQIIAISGNTGGSAGPHLHFETRSNRTENTVNPILNGIPVQDKISPAIFAIMLYEKDEAYRESTGNYPHKKYSTKAKSGITIKLPPKEYAFASQNRDHQLDRLNKLGINYSRLLVNDKEVYRSAIEKFAFDKSRYIQMHYDYYTMRKTGAVYTKLFLDKKNPLPFYKHKAKGWIDLKQGDTLKVRIEISDMALQKKAYSFTLIGDSTATAIPRKNHSNSFDLVARSWRNSSYNKDGLALDISSRAIYHDVKMQIVRQSNKYSKHSRLYKVHKDVIPVHTYFKLRLKVDDFAGVDASKLLIVNVDKYGNKVSEGGTFSSGWVATKTRSFGNYYVGHDTVAPKARVRINNRSIKVTVSDNLAGVDRYIASIDDQWILLEYHPNMKKMIGTIPDWVKPGEHLFELKVWDKRNNKTYKKFNITVQ